MIETSVVFNASQGRRSNFHNEKVIFFSISNMRASCFHCELFNDRLEGDF